jgi:exopolysaccharide production protein ExoY
MKHERVLEQGAPGGLVGGLIGEIPRSSASALRRAPIDPLRMERFRAELSREVRRKAAVVTIAPQLGGAVKRAMDIILALCGLAALAPLLALLALGVWLQDGGSPFYGQWRVGYGGRRFRCWKFRSMVKDADARLRAHLAQDPAAAAEWAETFKLKNDPRITLLGRLLRKSSLDELPQLFNILIGEMSLVGPRPVVNEELARFGASLRHYLRCRPGLTGLWQVSGRSDTSYAERVKLDRVYVERWSVWSDMAIIARTPLALVAGAGAY